MSEIFQNTPVKSFISEPPCFIIAEAGVNHNGDLQLAHRLIEVAAAAGANAIKFQTFDADKLTSRSARQASYQRDNTGVDESQYDMIERLELPLSAWAELYAACQAHNIVFMSTAFDETSADLLDELGMSLFKIPSGEITNPRLLQHIARKNKPMLISTGMANLGEVETAVQWVQSAGSPEITLLHCVSAYPADPAEANLRAMQTIRQAFDLPVGFSDHTLGIAVPLAAVALGASVIEKHFTLDKTLPGPDHKASLEPDELKTMIASIRTVESALGDGRKQPTPGEQDTAQVARRSLVAARDIAPDELITDELIAFKRPGTGLPPLLLQWVVGRRARVTIPADTLITLDMLA